MTNRIFDPERDFYESYMAVIAELRRRWLAGEYIPPEWRPDTRRAAPPATGRSR